MLSVALLLTNPGLPTCEDCKKYVYDKDWKRVKNAGTGKEMKRPPGAATPCYSCPKSLDRMTPNPEAEMTPRSQAAFNLYLQIKAGAPMPNDEIVRANCGKIRWVEDQIERSAAGAPLVLLAAMGAAAKSKGKK